MEMAIVALFIIALVVAGELGSKYSNYRKDKIMTVTKNRGPLKKRWRKLIVDIGRKVHYSQPYNKENRG